MKTPLVRIVRERRGMRQADLSRESGIAQNKLCAFETGTARPGLVNAKKLADALGVKVEEIAPWLAGAAR